MAALINRSLGIYPDWPHIGSLAAFVFATVLFFQHLVLPD
ncbi:hypothetical protein HAL1_10447 [Halomonas sp. HAL1]|nr:hypothetical protein HAL1_10447 [Halomonas sp. HAL1]